MAGNLKGNKEQGFIMLYRSIRDHWIWNDPIKLKWWLIMLFEANYSDSKFNIGYDIYDIKKGECVSSLRRWAQVFGCGTKQVTKFFNLLEKEGMIERKKIGKGKHSTTLINIVNYEQYHALTETQVTTQVTTQETTQGKHKKPHRGNTTGTHKNKGNKGNKGNKNIKLLLSEIEISDIPEENKNLRIAKSFHEMFVTVMAELGINNQTLKKAKADKWANTARLMLEQDGRTMEEMHEVWLFLQKDDFWRGRIYSMEAVRKKFDTLLMQIRKAEREKQETAERGASGRGATYEELAKILQKHTADLPQG